MYVNIYEIDIPKLKSSQLPITIFLGGFDNRELNNLITDFITINVENITRKNNIGDSKLISYLYFFLSVNISALSVCKRAFNS